MPIRCAVLTLWQATLLALALGTVLFLLARELAPVAPVVQAGIVTPAASASQPPVAVEVEVHSVLVLPSPTPVPTAAPSPTPSSLTPTINVCGTAVPGKVCQVPYLPPPLPTPYPGCGRVLATPSYAGDYCRWEG